MSSSVVIVVIYLILMIFAGNISARHSAKTPSGNGNYFGGSLPPWVMATAIVATSISGVGFIGTPGTAYIQGFAPYLGNTIL